MKERAARPRLKWGVTAAIFAFASLGGCENEAISLAPETHTITGEVMAQSAPMAGTNTNDRINFPPARIEALDSVAAEPVLVSSLLNVDRKMRYGDFVWNDEGVGPGKVWAMVDLAAQTISVFREGKEIGRAVTLFGVEGYPTPTGRFPILFRAKEHVSSIYDVPMPYTLRLTNDGVSIHASDVRSGVGTHGCVGVPIEFAAKLFDEMRVGDEVMVIGDQPVTASSREASNRAGSIPKADT